MRWSGTKDDDFLIYDKYIQITKLKALPKDQDLLRFLELMVYYYQQLHQTQENLGEKQKDTDWPFLFIFIEKGISQIEKRIICIYRVFIFFFLLMLMISN